MRDTALANWSPFYDFFYPAETAQPRDWTPKVDVYQQGTKTVLRAELPGVSREDIHVEIENGFLNLHGEKKGALKGEEITAQRVETSRGSFSRTFSLSDGLDPDSVEASYKDGVLTVVLQAKKEALPKKIDVKVC